MGKLLLLEVVERVKDGMLNCQTIIHILTMVLTTFVATFVEIGIRTIRRHLGVSMGKERPRNGNTAMFLDADPKNAWYLTCWWAERLTQYAATDLWITTTEPLKYAVF